MNTKDFLVEMGYSGDELKKLIRLFDLYLQGRKWYVMQRRYRFFKDTRHFIERSIETGAGFITKKYSDYPYRSYKTEEGAKAAIRLFRKRDARSVDGYFSPVGWQKDKIITLNRYYIKKPNIDE